MARGSTSTLFSLARLAEERRQFDAREAQARAGAAIEIGTAMFHASAETIELKTLERIVRRAAGLGSAEALKRLDAKGA
jgi:hypothetical protein